MKTLRLLFILLLGFYGHIGYAQAPSWQWARSAGGSGTDQAIAVTTDTNGNIYVTGIFGSSVITFGNILLSSNNGDIFLVKYDPSGNVIWAKNAGGTSRDLAYGLCTDINGNIYIAGGFESSTFTFGISTLFNTNPGFSNIFLAKFDASGNPLWAKGVSGSDNDEASGVKTDASGNVYITGFFTSHSITFDTTTLINAGQTDVFIAKYDQSGNVKWAQRAGGYYYDQANGIAIDPQDNVYITGTYGSVPITFGNITLPNPGQSCDFIVKYDPLGNVLWAKSDSGYSQEEDAISLDSKGNIIVAGDYTFKYNSSGDLIWRQKVSGLSVCTDQQDNVYVTAYFFHNDTIGNTILINSDQGPFFSSDIYVAGIDSSGNVIWAKNAKGSDNDFAYGISSDPSGNLYVTGYFESDTIIFDNNILLNSFFNESGDIFLARIGDFSAGVSPIPPTSPITVYPNPSTGSFYFSGLTEGSTIEVYDVMGQSVLISKGIANISSPQPLSQGEGLNSRVLDLSGRAAGVYFYRVSDQGATVQQGKIVVE